jgi:hypothetical protein
LPFSKHDVLSPSELFAIMETTFPRAKHYLHCLVENVVDFRSWFDGVVLNLTDFLKFRYFKFERRLGVPVMFYKVLLSLSFEILFSVCTFELFSFLACFLCCRSSSQTPGPQTPFRFSTPSLCNLLLLYPSLRSFPFACRQTFLQYIAFNMKG